MVLDNSIKQIADSVVEPAVSEPHRSIETSSRNECHSELVSESTNEMLSKGAKQQVQHDDYICTKFPVKDSDRSVWLGGEEIRRDVIGHYQRLSEKCGVDMQVVMDFDAELLSEEKLGYEKVESE